MNHPSAFVLCLFCIYTNVVAAQTLQKNWWVTDNAVRAIAIDTNNERVYIGGSFTSVGPNVPYGGAVTLSTGNVLSGFAQPISRVHIVVPAPDGGWFIGGSFSQVGGVMRNCIARLNADGSVNPWTANVGMGNYEVNALAVKGDTLYIGGWFGSIGGQTRVNLAAASITSGAILGFNPQPNATVTTLKVHNGILFAGGDFALIGPGLGGTPRSRLAAFNANSGTLLSWTPNPSGTVLDLAFNGDAIYIGGSFSEVYGQPRMGIAKVWFSTNTLASWDAGADAPVNSMEVSGIYVYAGGNFSTIGGVPRAHLSQLDITTGLATDWNPVMNGNVMDLELQGDTLCVGGQFTSVNGSVRQRLSFFDISSGNLLDLTVNASSTVGTICAQGNQLYAGGFFTSIGTTLRSGVAALDLRTGEATDWNPDVDGQVWALVLHDGDVLLGGSFDSVGGEARQNLAMVTAQGILDDWSPAANDLVRVLLVSGDTVYVGGDFYQIGGIDRNRLAAIDAMSGNLLGWDPNVNQNVYCLAKGNGRIYLGGTFGYVGGIARSRFAVVDATTGAVDLGFQLTGTAGTVRDLLLHNGRLFISGDFTGPFSTGQRTRMGAVDALSGALDPWAPTANSDVNALALGEGAMFAGGAFSLVNNQFQDGLVSLQDSDGHTLFWDPDPSGPVYTLQTGGPYLFAGGFFVGMDWPVVPCMDLAVFQITSTSVLDTLGHICPGDTLPVPFSIFGGFFSDNVFSAELSGPTGIFPDINPVLLDTINGTQADTCLVVIPLSAVPGVSYRLRINGSSPLTYGHTSMGFTIDTLRTWHPDLDGDGFGNPESLVTSCAMPPGCVLDGTDCDDALDTIFVGAPCDDGDSATTEDQWTDECECLGELTTLIPARHDLPELDYWYDSEMKILSFSEPVNGIVLNIEGRTVRKLISARSVLLHTLPAGVYVVLTETGQAIRFVATGY